MKETPKKTSNQTHPGEAGGRRKKNPLMGPVALLLAFYLLCSAGALPWASATSEPVVPGVGGAWSGPNDNPGAGDYTDDPNDTPAVVMAPVSAIPGQTSEILATFTVAPGVSELSIDYGDQISMVGWGTDYQYRVESAGAGFRFTVTPMRSFEFTAMFMFNPTANVSPGETVDITVDYTVDGYGNNTLYEEVLVVDPAWVPTVTISDAMTDYYGGSATTSLRLSTDVRVETLDVDVLFPECSAFLSPVNIYDKMGASWSKGPIDGGFNLRWMGWTYSTPSLQSGVQADLTFRMNAGMPMDVGGGREEYIPVHLSVNKCVVEVDGILVDVTTAAQNCAIDGTIADPTDNGACIYVAHTTQPDGNTLRTEVASRDYKASVYTAFYDENGKMLNVIAEPVLDTVPGAYNGLSAHVASIPGDAVTAKVMVLNWNLRPVAVPATVLIQSCG